MCGRFTTTFEFSQIKQTFNLQGDLPEFSVRHNIALSQKSLGYFARAGTERSQDDEMGSRPFLGARSVDRTQPPFVDAMLQPYPSEEFEAYDVSPIVNSPDNDGTFCITPA